MRYLWGIDGALDSSAVSIFDIDTFQHLNTINIATTPDKKKGERLRYLRLEIEKLKGQYPPYEVAIEGNFVHSTRFNANKDVFMSLGAIRDALYEYEPIAYAPKTVKLIIAASGDSSKSRMKRAVKLNFPDMNYKTDDEYDSVGIACCHLIKKFGMSWKVLTDDKGILKKKKKVAK